MFEVEKVWFLDTLHHYSDTMREEVSTPLERERRKIKGRALKYDVKIC